MKRPDTSPPHLELRDLTPDEARELRRKRRESEENAELAHVIRAWSSAGRKPTIDADKAIQDIRRGGRR